MGNEQETIGALERLPWGGDRRSNNFKASREASSGKSAAALAAQLGVSQATVERIRAVLDSDEEDLKAKLLAGEIAPYVAYRLLRQARWEHRMRAAAAQ